MEQNKKHIDHDFFEFIIALNITINEAYLVSVIDVIDLNYIKNPDIQKYSKIIIDFYHTRNKTPNATEIKAYLVSDELKTAYKNVVSKFKQLDTEYDYDELICNTEQYLKEKAMYGAVLQTVEKFSKENATIDTSKTLTLFENACNISLVSDIGFDYFNRIDDHIKDLTTEEKYISSGYKWIDKMLGGGFLERGRALYIFSGPTNSGKSIMLGNIATNILAQRKIVLLISLEMPEYIYSRRISAQLSKIPILRLKEESNQLKDFLTKYYKTHDGARLFIKEYAPHNVTPNHINAYIKKVCMKERIKPDAVILDYLTLIEPAHPTGSMFVDGKKVAEHVRSLSYTFPCPFISAIQSNRDAYDVADPSVKTTGESIGIPQTADVQMAIWNTDAEKELGIINIGMQKNRFGPNFGHTTLKIDYDTLAVNETEDVFSNTATVQGVSNTLAALEENS